MKKPLIVVQIVNFNGVSILGEKLDRVMRSVISQDYPNFIVNFIDNDSKDSSRERISSAYPGVRITKISRNIGYSAHNAGLRYFKYTEAPYLLIMNNDLILEDGALSKMSAYMDRNPNVGACMPVIFFASKPDYINSTGLKLNRAAFASNRDYARSENTYEYAGEEPVTLSGACMLVRREAIEQVGLFDYAYGSYYEDADFCIRLLCETDYGIGVVNGAKAFHYESASFSNYSSRKDFLTLRNQYLFILRNFTVTMQLKAFFYFAKTRFLKRIILHSRIFLSLLLEAPAIFTFRIRSAFRRRRSPLSFLETGYSPYPEESGIREYAKIFDENELKEKSVEEELVFGVNDSILGKGFSPLTEEFPQGRRINGKSAIFLVNRKKKFFRIVWYGKDAMHAVIEGKLFSSEHSPMVINNEFAEGVVKVELECSSDNLIMRAGFADEG